MTNNKIYVCRTCGLGFSDKDKAFDCCEGIVVVMDPSDGTIYNFRYTAETASDDFTRAMRDAGWALRVEPALMGDGRREWVHTNGSTVTDEHARDVWDELDRTPPPF